MGEKVSNNFSDLGTSMWTMFKLMTLENWVVTADQVIAVYGPMMRIFFSLFIFTASIALMSLVPAIFIELNMLARQKAEKSTSEHRMKRHRKERKEMLKRLFRLVEDDHSGYCTIAHIRNAVLDPSISRQLEELITQQGGELEDKYDLDLSLLDLCEKKREHEGPSARLSEDEFLKDLISGSDITIKTVWRLNISTRMQIRELSNLVRTELAEIKTALVRLQPQGAPRLQNSPG